MNTEVKKENWGEFDGQSVELCHISDGAYCSAAVLTYGCVLQNLITPDRNGQPSSIVLGLNNLQDYLDHSPSMGIIAGRYANRIADGRINHPAFKDLRLERNDGPNHLHGGFKGTGKRNWQIRSHSESHVELFLHIPDGEDGYPGNFDVTCTYEFFEPGMLILRMHATCDQLCPINLAQHSYFNLGNTDDVGDHFVTIHADQYSAIDAAAIPTHTQSLNNSVFDFRAARTLQHGSHLLACDHNFIRPESVHEELAIVEAPDTGRRMRLISDQPCVQFYAGHKISVAVPGLDGKTYGAYAGLCLEPQVAPNTPNGTDAESCFYGPKRDYYQTAEYRFETFG